MISLALKLQIERARLIQLDKKWPKLYWAIDLHDTIIPSSRTLGYESKVLFDGAKEALQEISKRDDQCIILWTATNPDVVWSEIVSWLDTYNIHVSYHNENPECKSEKYARFGGKFYFDVLLDDKAGFNITWWKDIDQIVRSW